MLAIRRTDTFTTTTAGGERSTVEPIAVVPGAGLPEDLRRRRAHGAREYHWARLAVQAAALRRGRSLLARRPLADPDQLAYHACCGPPDPLPRIWPAGGPRWPEVVLASRLCLRLLPTSPLDSVWRRRECARFPS